MLTLLCFIWALARRYAGLVQDGDLYAMQALSRLEPALRSDIYLANVSQDRFTCFSSLYAFVISQLGLWKAGVALFISCQLLFFASSWALVRCVSDSRQASLSLVLLIVVSGDYGAYGVFRFAEHYLTARSLSEAMVAAAIAAAVSGRLALAWAVIAASFIVHPLMTLPGALLLACLSMQPRRAAMWATIGLCIACVAAFVVVPLHLGGALQIIDGEWLEVVRQRSQFLFLDEWPLSSWMMHARSYLCLMLTYLALQDQRIRRLCIAAGLVGVSGLVLAWIAGSIGPIALLLQSQPWRWFWLTSFASIALLGPLAAALWRAGHVSRTCAVLVVISWVFPLANGPLMMGAALALWLVRDRLGDVMLRIVGLTGYVIIAVVAGWAIGNACSSLTAPLAENLDHYALLGHIRAIFQMEPVCVLLVLCALGWLRSFATNGSVLAAGLVGAVILVAALPGTLAQREGLIAASNIDSFQNWRDAIPQNASVLLVPMPVGAQFAWFTLGRASYLSMDQSAGVVFSRATAEEVVRRSEVLKSVMRPDWQIKRRITQKVTRESDRLPFTDASLRQICMDPALGFVVSSEKLSYPSTLHSAPGNYNGSRLYDCRQIRDMVWK